MWQWSLLVVLSQLMIAPFEPLGSCHLQLLSFRIAVLVAIVSARKVGELAALRDGHPVLFLLEFLLVCFYHVYI